MPKICVVTPTYNEKENLAELVEKVFSLRIPDLEMIVVDDNSPDGTGKLVEELGKQYPIKLISRPKKEGLGAAYADVFKKVLKFPEAEKPEIIIHLDADLSHDPELIPVFLEKIKNCDLVLGSRYIENGGIENWDIKRKLLSRVGNFYARTILGLPYRDLTGGFKCYKIKVIENMDWNSLSCVGYSFLIETTFRTHKAGYKISETPIIFTERTAGKSKISFVIIMEALWKVFLLRFKKLSDN